MKEYESAKDQQKKALIKPTAWTQLRDQITEAKTALSEMKEKRKRIEAERDKVERTRRTLGPIATLRAARAMLEELGDVTELPQDASSILSAALQDISMAEVQRSQEIERKQVYEEESDSIVIESNLLAQRAEIDALRLGARTVRIALRS